jgi:hypothetical protein
MLNLPPLPEDATYADTLREPVDAARATLRAVLADAALQTLRVLGSASEDLRNLAPDTTADPKGNLRAAAVLELCSTGSKLLESYNKTLSEVITPDDPALDQIRGVRPDSVPHLMRDMMGMIQASLGSAAGAETLPSAEPLPPTAEPYWVDARQDAPDGEPHPTAAMPRVTYDRRLPGPYVNYVANISLAGDSDDVPVARIPAGRPPYVKLDVGWSTPPQGWVEFFPYYMSIPEFVGAMEWVFALRTEQPGWLDPATVQRARVQCGALPGDERVVRDAAAYGLTWRLEMDTVNLENRRARVIFLRSMLEDFCERLAPEVERALRDGASGGDE